MPLRNIIEKAFEKRLQITPKNVDGEVRKAVNMVINNLDSGKLRSAEKINNKWVFHEWIKKSILLSFRIMGNVLLQDGVNSFYDKVPTKLNKWDQDKFDLAGFRTVPGAVLRKGSFVGQNVILMPCFINIGAYIDEGTMIDTWSTIGSCAQIGKNVHISGGVGIGGVLEPLQAQPTIIEDNCFIGARSEIVEGVIVEEGSVISMGVYIGQSTKIYDRSTSKISYGRIPAGSVVVPGSLPSSDNTHSIYCAVIVKKVDSKTLSKISINELLRMES